MRSDREVSKEVNTLLHTLRGEQYRHLRNTQRHFSSPHDCYSNSRTLPLGLKIPDYSDDPLPAPPALNHTSYSGPAPPKSWKPLPENIYHTPGWRAQALSLAASHLGNFVAFSRVPSLALICWQIVLSDQLSNSQFREMVPYIPAHLRRDVIRYCAIHSPLPSWKLYALFNAQGNADHEILIMGETASLRDDHFTMGTKWATDQIVQSSLDESDWESEDLSEELPKSLILVSTQLSSSTLLTLPPTLTHMALVNLPESIALYKLPKICPLLVLLDLSYNQWLKYLTTESSPLIRVDWTRWNHLEVLGLKDCAVSDELVARINQGRWDDIKIVI